MSLSSNTSRQVELIALDIILQQRNEIEASGVRNVSQETIESRSRHGCCLSSLHFDLRIYRNPHLRHHQDYSTEKFVSKTIWGRGFTTLGHKSRACVALVSRSRLTLLNTMFSCLHPSSLPHPPSLSHSALQVSLHTLSLSISAVPISLHSLSLLLSLFLFLSLSKSRCRQA